MILRIPRSPRGQRGATLAVVLILLVVLLLLSLASIRGTLLEQYMSTAQLDRSLSFQAAEAALREGEIAAADKPAILTPGGCNNGVCDVPPAGIKRWLDADANGVEDTSISLWNGISRAATQPVGANTAQPRYIIEVMAIMAIPGSLCTTSGDLSPDAACTSWESRYRITARSAATDRSEVILQSNLAVP